MGPGLTSDIDDAAEFMFKNIDCLVICVKLIRERATQLVQGAELNGLAE